ncbi:PPOX class F420-dependent oxidoreductase [Actinoplanes sp. CA-131856]
MPFTELEIAYLKEQPLGRLATLRPDGTLQNSPVGFRVDAATGTIDIPGYGMSGSRKYRNVAENGQVAFVVDDVPSVDPWRVRCVEIRGTAEATGEIIRIRPRRIISFGLDQPDADAHSLPVNSRNVTA